MHFKLLHMKKTLFPLSVLFFLSGCKPALEEKKATTGFTYNKPGGAPLPATRASAMVLSSPTKSPNFDSTPTFTLLGVVDGETVKIYRDSSCSFELGSAIANGSTAVITSEQLAVGTHNFYTKSININNETNCSGLMTSYKYLGISPQIASAMDLQSPAVSPGIDSTPTFVLDGVLSGETVKIYTNPACTDEVGSANAFATSVTITSSPLAPGFYTFYSKSLNSLGSSECSAALTYYQYLGVLPTAGSSVVLKSPTINPNYEPTPTFTVYGTANGDLVKIYTDAACTNVVGSALATTTSVDVQTSTLAIGSHSFYTNSSNIIGTSSCSLDFGSYQFLGPAPTVQVSWTANREKAVNSPGGGYRVFYSQTSDFNIQTAQYVDVPYDTGPNAPTTVDINGLLGGVHYFKIVAYSLLNPSGQSGGAQSEPSQQFQVSLP